MLNIDLEELDKYKEITIDDKVCPHCHYSNPHWMVECEMCGTILENKGRVLEDKDD